MQLQRQNQQHKMAWQQALRHKVKLQQMQLDPLPHH